MTVANSSYPALLQAASATGCVGVEVRNDLPGALFDGIDPVDAGYMAAESGLRILALAEVKSFNHYSDDVQANVEKLVSIAVACGAEGISLIPVNDSSGLDSESRRTNLKHAIATIKPLLEAHDLVGFIEPLGFASASIRHKAEVVEAIEEADAVGRFKIVHDTFHHYLVAQSPASLDASDCTKTETFYPEHTGIVHISGVASGSESVDSLRDEHRILVGPSDRLQNIQQLNALFAGGYAGPVSTEAFAPQVHQMSDPETKLTESFDYIVSATKAIAA